MSSISSVCRLNYNTDSSSNSQNTLMRERQLKYCLNKLRSNQLNWRSEQKLTTEVELWASAKGMNDVDDETVSGSSERKGTSGHQQSYHMEEVGEMCCHIQRIVKGEHQHVTCQDSNIIPHQVLLQGGSWRQTGLVDYFTHPPNHLQSNHSVLLHHSQLQQSHREATVELLCNLS